MSSRASAFGVRPPGFIGSRVAEWAPFTATSSGTMFGWSLNTTTAATVLTPALAPGFRTALRRTEFTCGGGAQRAAGLISSAAVCWRGNGATRNTTDVYDLTIYAAPSGLPYVRLVNLSTNVMLLRQQVVDLNVPEADAFLAVRAQIQGAPATRGCRSW